MLLSHFLPSFHLPFTLQNIHSQYTPNSHLQSNLRSSHCPLRWVQTRLRLGHCISAHRAACVQNEENRDQHFLNMQEMSLTATRIHCSPLESESHPDTRNSNTPQAQAPLLAEMGLFLPCNKQLRACWRCDTAVTPLLCRRFVC